MPWSLGFKPCMACCKLMPISDLCFSCLKCLGESHLWAHCRICKGFKSHTKKNRDQRLRLFFMEAALCTLLEPSHADSVPGTSVSVRSIPASERQHSSAPAALGKDSSSMFRDSRHCPVSPCKGGLCPKGTLSTVPNHWYQERSRGRLVLRSTSSQGPWITEMPAECDLCQVTQTQKLPAWDH